jgi:hypothetical protein
LTRQLKVVHVLEILEHEMSVFCSYIRCYPFDDIHPDSVFQQFVILPSPL